MTWERILHGKKDAAMLHLQLASLKGPMNIVAMDSQEERYQISYHGVIY